MLCMFNYNIVLPRTQFDAWVNIWYYFFPYCSDEGIKLTSKQQLSITCFYFNWLNLLSKMIKVQPKDIKLIKEFALLLKMIT
jgi:hypothetical protein